MKGGCGMKASRERVLVVAHIRTTHHHQVGMQASCHVLSSGRGFLPRTVGPGRRHANVAAIEGQPWCSVPAAVQCPTLNGCVSPGVLPAWVRQKHW